MAGEVPLNDIVTLVLGTSAMLIMVIAIIGFAFVFQRKLITKERAYRDIEKLLQMQEIKSAYSLIEGQERERKRIAADIHDNVGNLLATLKIFSDLVLNQEHSPEVKRLNLKIGAIADAVTTEIRKISHSLDSGVVQDFGLKAAIDQLVEAIQNSGKIEMTVHYDVSRSLSGEWSINIYRIIQELVTNTLKHAHATKARIEISQVNGEISIIFEDNGVGFDTEATKKHGLGLKNITSRVSHLQGEIKIQSSSLGSAFIIELPNQH
jgi:signal transduction histidine kinase